MMPSFKPSQINVFARSYLPFIDTFGKAEIEIAAAMVVATLAHHGDDWAPVTPRQIGEWMQSVANQKTETPRHVSPREPWFDVLKNPFGSPDFIALVENGWAAWVEDGNTDRRRPIELTEAFFERIVEKGWSR